MKTPTEEETLRLVRLFYQIPQPEQRAEILRLAEKYANQADANKKSAQMKDSS
jgi:hypothetical protein